MKLTDNVQENIENLKKIAAQVYNDNEVMQQIAVAQAIHESNILIKPSKLAREYNNLFGIKRSGTNGLVYLPTDEYINGKLIHPTEPFGWNKTLEDSFQQHKDLMFNGTKDNQSRYHTVLHAETFEEAAHALYNNGYATDKKYPEKLIDIKNKIYSEGV